MQKLRFECGCSFDILDDRGIEEVIKFGDSELVVKLPRIDFDIEKIPLDCPATWDLIGEGNTRGVWQLESPLGKSWAKRLKPTHIEELSALNALLRPGCLHALSGDPPKSMTQRYVDRKHGDEEVEYLHPSLENALKTTYGVLVYQEQAMQIARDIAGFDLQQADILRKAIGKKKVEIMEKVEGDFMTGCKKAGIVSEEIAKEVFNWIRESQNYSFNKSHAVSYAVIAYRTAYLKAHFPIVFYASYLKGARWKNQKSAEEIYDFVKEAQMNDVEIYGPRLSRMRSRFSLEDEGKLTGIHFGLADIKGIGESAVDKLRNAVEEAPVEPKTWLEYLVFCSNKVPSDANKSFICSGAFDEFQTPRRQMDFELQHFLVLTDKEVQWIQSKWDEFNWTTFGEVLEAVAPTKKEGGGTHNVKRSAKVTDLLQIVQHPPYDLTDTLDWIAFQEQKALSVSVSCSKADASEEAALANCSCRDFSNGHGNDYVTLAVEVNRVKSFRTKNGKNAGATMCFIDVSDSTGTISITAFPNVWNEYSGLLSEGNTVMLTGYRDKKYNSFVINEVRQI